MGQSTTGSSGNARGETVAEEFRSLQDLVGDWFVDEFVFRTPNAQPIVNSGRTTCRSVIGQLAIVVITEITTSGEQTVTLNTFDPRQNRYELALVDSTSDTGVILMTGQTLNQRSSPEIRAQFGKAAIAVREWTLATGQAGQTGGGQIGFDIERIIENQISNDRWVIQFFGRAQGQGGQGQQGQFLLRQQVLTRVQPGCQPLVGCNLGCPGLLGCQEGCQGLQSPQAQTGCACQSQSMGQTQLMGQTQAMAQTQPCQQQLIVQPPVVCPPQLVAQIPLVSLVPSLCQPLVACPRQPVRPPEQLGRNDQPGHPGQPGHGK